MAALGDGRVVSASDDKTLRVWDVDSGDTLRVLEGHTAGVHSVADLSGRVVSASDDKTLRVWDDDSDDALAVFTLDTPATAVVIVTTAKGLVLIAGDTAGRVHFLDWNDPKQDLHTHSMPAAPRSGPRR